MRECQKSRCDHRAKTCDGRNQTYAHEAQIEGPCNPSSLFGEPAASGPDRPPRACDQRIWPSNQREKQSFRSRVKAVARITAMRSNGSTRKASRRVARTIIRRKAPSTNPKPRKIQPKLQQLRSHYLEVDTFPRNLSEWSSWDLVLGVY